MGEEALNHMKWCNVLAGKLSTYFTLSSETLKSLFHRHLLLQLMSDILLWLKETHWILRTYVWYWCTDSKFDSKQAHFDVPLKMTISYMYSHGANISVWKTGQSAVHRKALSGDVEFPYQPLQAEPVRTQGGFRLCPHADQPDCQGGLFLGSTALCGNWAT